MFNYEKAVASEYFVTVNDVEVQGKITVCLDDTIMVKGQLVTAGSKMLENFVAPFEATVVKKLNDADVAIIGKSKVREFGIGTMIKDDFIPCGLLVVKDELCDVLIANDFSGEYRRKAAEMGLVYIHPTYGTVSRFGLIQAFSSVDRLGVAARDAETAFKVLSIIAGHDSNDGTSYPQESYEYNCDISASDIKAAVAYIGDNTEKTKAAAEKLSATEENLPFSDAVNAVQYILSCAEISNNITRYDGIKFGYRAKDYNGLNELYLKTRTEGFTLDTKLTSVMGAMVLSESYYEKYYNKSMQIRRLVKNELEALFEKYDVWFFPALYQRTKHLMKIQFLQRMQTLQVCRHSAFAECSLSQIQRRKTYFTA